MRREPNILAAVLAPPGEEEDTVSLMDFICCFRPHHSCRGISVSSASSLSSLPAANRFLPTTSVRIRIPTTPFLQYPKFSIETHAKKKKNTSKTTIFEPKPNKEEDESLFEENEEEDDKFSFGSAELLTDEEEDDFYLEEKRRRRTLCWRWRWWRRHQARRNHMGQRSIVLSRESLRVFNGELGIYAFKTLPNSTIQVRIERLSNKSGSPTMEDIEAYSTTYRAKLSEAELAKTVPDNISLEVSSPGVERVVRVPQDLDRYKDRSMYVRYVNEEAERDGDGIFRLVSFDVEAKSCVWGVADIRVNREKAGKGDL
ncbi:hypothetical protein Rs2_50643 [Raphanus sativus]|nr:hypothetical protein Rs2_50643 [Raphanus sativus]